MITSAFFQTVNPPLSAARWVVGFSGGLDSMVLLHLCVQYRDCHAPDLVLKAVHVNHGLSSGADSWQAFCRQYCERKGVEFQAVQVCVNPGARQSIEQVARERRYQVFREQCTSDDLLLLAHHLDDQVETLLYRLMRGTGISGLRAMRSMIRQQSRGSQLAIWRPLLAESRAALLEYAQLEGLSWVEDPSNRDDSFDRNFIRQRVVPLLEQRWPGFRKTLARLTRHAAQAHELSRALAELDIAAADKTDHLALEPLVKLTVARIKNLLRYWLERQGANPPNEKVLDEIVSAITGYHPEQNTKISWLADSSVDNERWSIRTYKASIWLVPELPAVDSGFSCQMPDSGSYPLPCAMGSIELEQGAHYCGGSAEEGLYIKLNHSRSWRLAFRQGSEFFRPAGRKQKLLKKWLQDWHCPPWQRHHIPLIFCDDTLVAVVGHGVAEGWQPQEGEPFIRVIWRRSSD